MPEGDGDHPLRVLIADESAERVATLSAIVRSGGHEIAATETAVSKVREATLRTHPDVALVALGESEEHALEMIASIVAEAECPVIAVVSERNASFAQHAAIRGVYGYVVESDPEGLESALQIVLLRFREYHGLEGAFGRRAQIEQAKGILMERHHVDARAAFEVLRGHARRNNAKIVDVAAAVIEGTLVLPPR